MRRVCGADDEGVAVQGDDDLVTVATSIVGDVVEADDVWCWCGALRSQVFLSSLPSPRMPVSIVCVCCHFF